MRAAASRSRTPTGARFRTVCFACRRTVARAFTAFCAACGAMTDVEYDLSRVELPESDDPYRRFRDLLPIEDARLLPEDALATPTLHATRLGEALGLPWLYLKDETKQPTGTTKDRMAATALAYLQECGARGFCTSSTGNSSTAFAHAIARTPELTMYLFTAEQFCDRVQASASERIVHFVLRDASFVDAAQASADFAKEHGLVAEQGFFNPARREGLKLAWLEAVDQVPRAIDRYVQAVSSAMGVYGAFKGAKELRELRRIERLPRLLCVQQETCAPMVAAWRDGSNRIRPQDLVPRPEGIAKAILRGNPTRAYPYVHAIVRESGGELVAVSEREIREARRLVEDLEGVSPCFAASAAVAGLTKQARSGAVSSAETVLVNLTGRDRDEPTSITDPHWLVREGDRWIREDPSRAIPGLSR